MGAAASSSPDALRPVAGWLAYGLEGPVAASRLAVASELPKSLTLRVNLISLVETLPVKMTRTSRSWMDSSSTSVNCSPLILPSLDVTSRVSPFVSTVALPVTVGTHGCSRLRNGS
jgi:hypothetical protein